MDYDILFHLQIAEEYHRNGMLSSIPWAVESVWKLGYFDTHFLYHIFLILIPWLGISPQFWISLFFAVGLLCYLFLVQPKTNRDFILFTALYLIGSYVFTGRVLFGKGLVVFLPVFFLYLIAWKRNSPISVFFLSWVAIWVYPLAFLLVVFSVLDFGIRFLSQRGSFKTAGKLPLYSLLGILFGFLLHPSFPRQFLGYRLEWVGQIFPPSGIEPIAEWNPPGLFLYSNAYMIILIPGIYLFVLKVSGDFQKSKKNKTNKLLNSKFIESVVVFFTHFRKKTDTVAILFLLGLVSSWFTSKSLEWALPMGMVVMGAHRKRLVALVFRSRWGVFFLLVLIVQFFLFANSTKNHSQGRKDNDRRELGILLCSEWDRGEKIWILWDDFPQFSRECNRMQYPFGMNPLYSYAKDANRYNLIQKYWSTQSPTRTDLPSYMGYNTVVLDGKRDNPHLIQSYIMSEDWKKVYEKNNNFIFRYNKNTKKDNRE